MPLFICITALVMLSLLAAVLYQRRMRPVVRRARIAQAQRETQQRMEALTNQALREMRRVVSHSRSSRYP